MPWFQTIFGVGNDIWYLIFVICYLQLCQQQIMNSEFFITAGQPQPAEP